MYIIYAFSVCRSGVVIKKQYREVVEQDNRTHNYSFKTPPLCRHKNPETAFPCKNFLTQIRVQRFFHCVVMLSSMLSEPLLLVRYRARHTLGDLFPTSPRGEPHSDTVINDLAYLHPMNYWLVVLLISFSPFNFFPGTSSSSHWLAKQKGGRCSSNSENVHFHRALV